MRTSCELSNCLAMYPALYILSSTPGVLGVFEEGHGKEGAIALCANMMEGCEDVTKGHLTVGFLS